MVDDQSLIILVEMIAAVSVPRQWQPRTKQAMILQSVDLPFYIRVTCHAARQ